MSVPFQVIPYNNLEYDAQFMDMVDQLNLESDTGPNIYLCFFSLKTKGFIGYYPRESVIKVFTSDKKKLKDSTEERTITIGGTTIYYFLKLLGINDFLSFSSVSKDTNDGNSAKSKYGKIYDAILDSYSKNNCFIIYASDIESADKLFKDAVKNSTITSDDITSAKYVEKKKTRFEVDRVINDQKQEEEKQKKIAADEENIKKGKERSKLIQDAITSIPDTVDLRWQVFTIHDIGDTIVSENTVLPKFSQPVSDWNPTKPPINIVDSYSKKGIPSNDAKGTIPQYFSWVKKVNESKSIHVISVKITDRPRNLGSFPKYTILGQKDMYYEYKPDIKARSYEVTIEKLELNGRHSNDELEFKKRMILPFIDKPENNGEKYFVLNAEEDEIAGETDDAREIKVLRYFLRKYGIGYVESPVEKKYTFKFTHDDYINIHINTNNSIATLLHFGKTPIRLFDAIPFVLHCLKNDKLLMKQIDNGPSTPTPEVLVLSQLTKDIISSATSVYFVVEKNTKHRKAASREAGRGFVFDYFGDIDGFTGPVVMHNKKWSLGCVQSILDEPECTTYNELTLLASDEENGALFKPYGIDGYKTYLSTGIFPESFSVTRGSDDYCKFVGLEPYGNVFDKSWNACKKYDRCFDQVISRPDVGLENEQHPVFYIFNAANKASAVNAFNAKLQEELKKVISVEDGKNVVNKANLDSNQFLKTFNSFNYIYGTLSIPKESIKPFIESIITDGTPNIDLLCPENIQLESVERVYTTTSSSVNPDAFDPIRSIHEATSITVPVDNIGGKSNKKRTKKSRRNKVRSNKRNVRSNKRATRSNKRKYNNTRKK